MLAADGCLELLLASPCNWSHLPRTDHPEINLSQSHTFCRRAAFEDLIGDVKMVPGDGLFDHNALND